MKFIIKKSHIADLKESNPNLTVDFPFLASLLDVQDRYGSDETTVPLPKDDMPQIDNFLTFLKGKSQFHGLYSSVKIAKDIMLDPMNGKICGSLKMLETALKKILSGLPHLMVFFKGKNSDIMLPYIVNSVRFVNGRQDSPDYVSVSLCAWVNGTNATKEINFHSSDLIKGSSAKSILLTSGYCVEDEELYDHYLKNTERFLSLWQSHGEQYSYTANKQCASSVCDSNNRYSHNSSIYFVGDKFVNNVNNCEKTIRSPKPFVTFMTKQEVEEAIHPMMYVHSLKTYSDLWVHIDQLEVYKYNTEVINKLVLHPEHRDLIDSLSETYGLNIDDFVEGKSGGTIILSIGKAGTGKTLTAEVLSEKLERPLYRLNVSQLGTEPQTIEKNLQKFLTTANSWDAVTLLDEADLYIMTRGSDLKHNGIVTVFLKTLEYCQGLVFLTTNRTDTIDEAVLSRCTAVINYEYPIAEARLEIWKLMNDQYELNLNDDLIRSLNDIWVCSGRDIKMLCILVKKYCKSKQITPTEEVFRKLSIFRNLSAI